MQQFITGRIIRVPLNELL